MHSFARAAQAAVVAGCLTATVGAAEAGVMDFLFGKSNAAAEARQPDARRKHWPIGDFTEVRVVPIEAGAAPNSQPLTLSTNTLRDLLNQVRFASGGSSESLFSREELDALLDPLVDAFQVAAANEDVQLVSSGRHGGGVLTAPTAITARLFVQGGNLNLIVHDARFEYFGEYRGAGKVPVFTYGSRTVAGADALDRAGSIRRRADWLEMPLTAVASTPAMTPGTTPGTTPGATVAAPAAAPAAAARPAPATTMAPPASPAPAAVAPMPAPAAVAPAAPARPRDAAFFDEQEQRLAALKRLRERNLISEEEYQQKRSEILKSL